MSDEISATGWLVILCALALGFGLVKFLIVQMNDAREAGANERAAPRTPAESDRDDDTRI